MKNTTARIITIGLPLLTIASMVAISNIPGISGNPVVSLITGVALGVLVGTFLKAVKRKLRAKISN